MLQLISQYTSYKGDNGDALLLASCVDTGTAHEAVQEGVVNKVFGTLELMGFVVKFMAKEFRTVCVIRNTALISPLWVRGAQIPGSIRGEAAKVQNVRLQEFTISIRFAITTDGSRREISLAHCCTSYLTPLLRSQNMLRELQSAVKKIIYNMYLTLSFRNISI
jgi:hypothetical protein